MLQLSHSDPPSLPLLGTHAPNLSTELLQVFCKHPPWFPDLSVLTKIHQAPSKSGDGTKLWLRSLLGKENSQTFEKDLKTKSFCFHGREISGRALITPYDISACVPSPV